MTPAIPRIAVQSSAAPPRVGGEIGSPPCPRIGEAWPSSAGQSPAPRGVLQNTAQQSGPVPISPWPKSIRGLWALENLGFSRELCSRHLIREVQQAVCPQPVRPQPAGRRRWPAPPNRCREGDSVPLALPSTRPPPSDHWADPKSLPTRRHRPPAEEFLSTRS